MKIQWYPGHMHKARREISKSLSKIDLVIEIIDARIPYSSENPVLADLRREKPCIMVMNKVDLADPELTERWQAYFTHHSESVSTLTVSTKEPASVKSLPSLIRKSLSAHRETINAMIVGIPNVGKSTLINTLAGRSIAKTGNEPAITKAQQRIKLGGGITLSDTPGVLWPNVENRNSGFRLAATGAIRDTAMEYPETALFLAEYLMQNYPLDLKSRYGLDEIPDSQMELMELIGAKRGCLRSGGMVDLEKVSRLFLIDFRSGAIGQITLESPEDMIREKAELDREREMKRADKLARKGRRKQRK